MDEKRHWIEQKHVVVCSQRCKPLFQSNTNEFRVTFSDPRRERRPWTHAKARVEGLERHSPFEGK